MCYLVHPDSKCLLEVTFYVVNNNGSVLLSYATTLALGLIQPCTRLDYLPPRASLITSSADHLRRPNPNSMCKFQRKNQKYLNHKDVVSKLITSKEEILANYSDVLMVLDAFLVPHTIFRWILVSHQSKPPVN